MANAASVLTYQGLIDQATQLLYEASETPRIDAEILIQHVLEKPLAWLIAYGDSIATADHIKAYYTLLTKRQHGEPIAYLVGKRDFWTLTLQVNHDVLIPRPDTETLVDEALNRLPNNTDLSILDLGTGSGAIALSIAKERPQAKVLAVDAHAAALNVAHQNAQNNHISNTEFLQSDWFTGIAKNKRFDLIASNPPYIETGDPHLTQGDLRFEPSSALVSDEQGLADLQLIISQAPGFLLEQGSLIVEHGYNQAEAVAQLFHNHGFRNIELYQDINELPRCTAGQCQ